MKDDPFTRWWMEAFTTQMIVRDMLNDIATDKEHHFGLVDARLGKEFYSKIRDPFWKPTEAK